MRKFWVTSFLLLGLFCSVFAQSSAVLKTDPNSWTMVLLPDLQNYSKNIQNQPIMDIMTRWILVNKEALSIRVVLATGDLVDQNNMPVSKAGKGNVGSNLQWKAVSKAFETLDDRIPYILAAGNHDFGFSNSENRETQFGKYFPVERNQYLENALVGVCKATGSSSLENAAYELDSPVGPDFLILSLEFSPREVVIQWAKELISLPKYKDYRCIVLTHSYLQWTGARIEKENYPLKDTNAGQALWEKLIYPSDNICLVISGHIGSLNGFRENVGYSTDMNHSGKKIHQMVFNAQTLGGTDWSNNNGGDGWLRLLEFLPDGKTVCVRTFSPLFAISPATQPFAWRKDAFDQFSFVLE
ncbi:MAG: metallophosphoesterase [Bacteroidales bacterium]|nr:metallophosphoesterase [Bacteroidales bacterium]